MLAVENEACLQMRYRFGFLSLVATVNNYEVKIKFFYDMDYLKRKKYGDQKIIFKK